MFRINYSIFQTNCKYQHIFKVFSITNSFLIFLSYACLNFDIEYKFVLYVNGTQMAHKNFNKGVGLLKVLEIRVVLWRYQQTVNLPSFECVSSNPTPSSKNSLVSNLVKYHLHMYFINLCNKLIIIRLN